MQLKDKKFICEGYGLMRMILGIGQIVGLSAGYFLTEYIIRYPKEISYYIIDQDVLALTYLAVILRAIFHMICGIGIARIRIWGKLWIQYGWPIMAVITFGLIYSISHEWILDGIARSVFQLIVWPKILLYFGLIGFDYLFICKSITDINNSKLESEGAALDLKKIFTVFFIAVLAFSIILFLGKPIKQGFHQGFYKSKGEMRKTSIQKTKLPVRKPASSQTGTQEKQETPVKSEEVLSESQKIVSIVVDEQRPKPAVKKQTPKEEKRTAQKRMPYRDMMGLLAGCLVIGALVYQFFELKNTKTQNISPSLVLFGLGFFLWMAYGLSMKLMPVTLTNFLACLAVVCIFLFRSNNN